MGFLKSLEQVRSCSDYKDVVDDTYILAHGYLEDVGESDWEIGFYNEDTDKMLVFNTNPPRKKTEDDVMKSGKTIHSLNEEEVAVEFEEAMRVARDFLKKSRVGGELKKTMALVQNLGVQVWNITFITKQLEVANIKIRTDNGDIHDSTVDNLLNWGKAV